MNDYNSFLQLIPADKELMVDRLIKWASINSGSHNFQGLELMLEVLAEDFAILGGKMETIKLSEDPNIPKALRISCRPKAPIQILLNGHIDTVYTKDDPFQACTKKGEDVLQGPGVADMKGGLVILLEVLTVFEQCPWAKNIGWEVLIVPDEETGSSHSSHLFESAAKRHTFGLIFEPCLPDGSLARSRKGVGTFTAVAHGTAGHAGRDFKREDNAIVGLAHFIAKVDELHMEFPTAIFNIGHVEGGGVLNIIPDNAVAKIMIRMNTFEERARIEERLRELVDSLNCKQKVQIELSGRFNRPPKPPSEGADALFKEFENCGKELGIVLGWKDTGGASDGNNLAAAGLANIDNLGVHGDNIHSDKEHVFLDSLVQRTQLSLLFLMKLASGEISLPKDLFPNQHNLT